MDEKLILQLENRLERLIEGAFARLFSRRLNTQDIALHLARSMEDNLQPPSGDNPHFIAPDTYTIRLNTGVYRQLHDRLPGLSAALAQYMTDMTTKSGYRLLQTPTIHLKPAANFSEGTIQVQATHSQHTAEKTGALERIQLPDDSNTPRNPYLIVNGEHNIPLNTILVNIGRSDDNDIVLDDRHISRHHLQLRRRNGTYMLFDTGSRAGTYINNVSVREHTLQTGDVIQLGSTRLTYIMDAPDNDQNAGTTAMMPPYSTE